MYNKFDKVIDDFWNNTEPGGDLYIIIRVLKKCYDYSKDNPFHLIPAYVSST